MKKILCFALALILSLGLISCDEYLSTSSDNVVQPDIITSCIEEVSSIEKASSMEEVSSEEAVSSQVTSSKENVTQNVEKMVWIPQSGKKYHSNSACSGMKNPTKVTVEKAVSLGFTPCKKCY